MPMVENLLGELAGVVWMSKLDRNKGFYQLLLAREAQAIQPSALPGGSFTSCVCQ